MLSGRILSPLLLMRIQTARRLRFFRQRMRRWRFHNRFRLPKLSFLSNQSNLLNRFDRCSQYNPYSLYNQYSQYKQFSRYSPYNQLSLCNLYKPYNQCNQCNRCLSSLKLNSIIKQKKLLKSDAAKSVSANYVRLSSSMTTALLRNTCLMSRK